MRAAMLDRYDKNGRDLEVREVPVPSVGERDILVRVLAAGVNPLDNMVVRGEVRMIVPYGTPLVMGNEFVGVVEQAGSAVGSLAEGQRVYGRMPLARIGAFAEYVAVPGASVAPVPEYLSDEEAACVPLTALTAWQAFELLGPKAGESIFISGGTGSFGAMAIPLANSLGLNVITNGGASGEERVRALGASRFIDYKSEDYADVLRDVDHVIDTLGERELPREFGVLKRGGGLVSLRGMPNGEFAARSGMGLARRVMFKAAGLRYDRMAARRGQRYHFIFVHEDGAGLRELSRVLEERRVPVSVDGVFGLDDVNAALAKVAAGGSRGKTILRVA